MEVIIQEKSGVKEMCLTTSEAPRVSPSAGTQLRSDCQGLERGENREALFNENSQLCNMKASSRHTRFLHNRVSITDTTELNTLKWLKC